MEVRGTQKLMWEALREAVDEEMEKDPTVCLMGTAHDWHSTIVHSTATANGTTIQTVFVPTLSSSLGGLMASNDRCANPKQCTPECSLLRQNIAPV